MSNTGLLMRCCSFSSWRSPATGVRQTMPSNRFESQVIHSQFPGAVPFSRKQPPQPDFPKVPTGFSKVLREFSKVLSVFAVLSTAASAQSVASRPRLTLQSPARHISPSTGINKTRDTRRLWLISPVIHHFYVIFRSLSNLAGRQTAAAKQRLHIGL